LHGAPADVAVELLDRQRVARVVHDDARELVFDHCQGLPDPVVAQIEEHLVVGRPLVDAGGNDVLVQQDPGRVPDVVQGRPLDLGTGVGWPAYWITEPGRQVIGVDPSESMIRLASQARRKWGRRGVELVCATGERLPFADDSFDSVVMDAVLELTQDAGRVLSEVHRVLAPNGLVVSKSTNWKVALGRRFGGFRDGGRILYPRIEARSFLVGGEPVLKFRRCLYEPPQERTYFVGLEKPDWILDIVRSVEEGDVQQASALLLESGAAWAEGAICQQFDPNTLLNLFASCGFDVKAMHGCREIGTVLATELRSQNTLGFYIILRWLFRPITEALFAVAAMHSIPRLDMVVVAKPKN
jgi:SAM-dependent methyltransferase